MADFIEKYADGASKELEKRIKRVYKQAAGEVQKKLDDFIKRHKAKNARMLQMVDAGQISEQDYKRWLQGQIFQGRQWKRKLKDITEVYVGADEKARDIVGKTTKNVFMEAANYSAYEIEKNTSGAIAFNVYDAKTVERLLKDDPKMLPEWKIDEPKDYIWNEKRVRNAVTQGIIQGESIAEVGNRLTTELSTSNAKKMNMFARTAVNGAQNAGRMDRLYEAEKKGIDVRRKWLATLDGRTRDTHRALDGQVQKTKDPFTIDGMSIRFPGDPTAPARLVYNCRCTLVYVYPKYQHLQHDHERRDQLNDRNIENMTYYQWVGLKERSKRTDTNKQVDNVEFGGLFPSESKKIAEHTINQLEKEYPLKQRFDFVGDGRISRGIDQDMDFMDIKESNIKGVSGEGGKYLAPGNNISPNKMQRIEIFKEDVSTQSLKSEFDDMYKLRKSFDENPILANALFNSSYTLEGSLTHEYGHALAENYGFFAHVTKEGTEFNQWLTGFMKAHPTEVLSVSRYATTNVGELFAEAFVTSFDDEHKDTMAYKTAEKIMAEFKKRFLKKAR